ncbi:MAG: Asp-tRNA(Asn)/Glu-tRNA(Gln) amidotransferase subunit GatA [Myxococcales bacterium]|nr:Asp-tRNA(Asn)/Glu-tRNA(Gln) amidotransferase subunit GatA [Myxococcales bacterium]
MIARGIKQLRRAFDEGETTPEALVDEALRRIESGDSELGAFLHLASEQARKRASDSTLRYRAGNARPLEGIPIALKDVICTAEMPTTCASRLLDGYRPPYSATVVERLEGAGAIIVGKVNNDEFAMGSSTENSGYQLTRNPWDPSRTPGGSSGGSAAAVAARFVPAALGTDTGGSIRQPASFCGIVGLKPTYGRVSRYGLVAYASSLDQIGPLASSAEDCAEILQIVAGGDPRDSTCVTHPVPSYLAELGQPLAGLRLGLPREYWGEGLAPDVASSARGALEVYRELGAELVELELPHTEYAVAAYYLVATAEASSNLARFDGVRYGVRKSAEGGSLLEMYKATRHDGFGSEVKRRIMLGTYALSAGYYDAYYLKALKVRSLIRDDFLRAFARCDAIVGPTMPDVAFPIGAYVDDPLQMYLTDIFTVTANLAGLPAISFPCGVGGGGLPVGLQLIAPAFAESLLLRAVHRYQQATDWHHRVPARYAE